MFDKRQNSCVKRIHLANDDRLYDRKDLCTVKRIVFIHPLRMITNLSIIKSTSVIGRPDHESKNEMVFDKQASL